MTIERYFAFTNVRASDGAELPNQGRIYYGQAGQRSREEALAEADEVAGRMVAKGGFEHITVLEVSVDYFAKQVSSHRRPL